MVNRSSRRTSREKVLPAKSTKSTSRMSQTALLITVIAVLIFSLLNIAIYLAPLPLRGNYGTEQGALDLQQTSDSAPPHLQAGGEVSITIQQSPSSEGGKS